MNPDTLAEQVRTAKIELERARLSHANHLCDYATIETAARKVCNLHFDYQKAKFPNIKPKRIPFQAMLR